MAQTLTRGELTEIYTRLDKHDISLAVHDSYFKLIAAGLSVIITGIMFLVVKALGG